MLRSLLALMLTLGLAVPALAARPIPRPPLIEAAHAEHPIELQSLRVSAELSGGMALTTVDMVFFNPNQRQLEGNLQFPLLDGQQITGFALDVEGKLRPAVPVEKEKGRQIFEAIERRQVDPGLLEQTQGNNFRLRIYPIGARATRSVQLKYAESMARQGTNWVYQLPLGFGEQARDFDLALTVHGASGAPQASGTLGRVDFDGKGADFLAHLASHKLAGSATLKLLVPSRAGAQSYTEVRGADTWFLAEIPVRESSTPRTLPKVIGLLWDSSGSGAARDVAAELAELDAYFKALGNAEVRLTRLRDRSEARKSYSVVRGDWSALKQALQATVYDGASALNDWQAQADVGEYLLFSDGLDNYGSAPFPTLRPGQRLYALNSALASDSARLAAWAEASGGRLLQVSSHAPGAAAKALLSDGTRVTALSATGASELQLESNEARHGMLRVAGRLRAAQGALHLTVKSGGASETLTIPLSADAPSHPLAGTMWAGYRLRALEANPELHRAEMRRLGQQFGIANRETSLIVLDLLEDYLRYDVAPPPELAPAFTQMKSLRALEASRARASHLDEVLAQFESKRAWWQASYPKDNPRAPKDARKTEGLRGLSTDDARRSAPAQVELAMPVHEMAAAPAAPPPSPIVAGNGPAAAKSSQRVSVTGSNVRRDDSMADKKTARGEAASAPEIGIALKKWSANAPYIARLKAAAPNAAYAIYLDEKPGYANSSAFFLDCADILLEKGQRELALRVLSNLAEMDLENRAVLRILGYRLLQAGQPALAIPVFEKVVRLAAEEPQSFRDLGLAYAANKQYQQAINQLNEVLLRPWDGRFQEIEAIVLAELNAIVATAGVRLDTRAIDPRLLMNMPLDLRVVLTWDADNADMDLWVTDPNGEKCFYASPASYQGGRMSRDFTQGYGPEEFSLRQAKPGKYKIEANYYGNRQQVLAGATTLQVRLSSGFGTARQKDQMITLRLKERSESVFVGEFEVKP
ncbi:MAG: VIT domain-containing protein [Pseudomonadota bacterium]